MYTQDTSWYGLCPVILSASSDTKAAKSCMALHSVQLWPLSVSDEADSIAGAVAQDEARSAIEISLSKLGVETPMTCSMRHCMEAFTESGTPFPAQYTRLL